MMDKGNDIFKELSIRVKNPLIFSFAISWVLTNWRIVFAFLTYNFNDYRTLGYDSFVDYASANSSNYRTWIIPLSCAVLYTILIPIFRSVINVYNAGVTKRGYKRELKVSDDSYVPFKKFYQVQKNYIDKTKELRDLFKKELEITQQNAELALQIAKVQNERNEQSEKSDELYLQNSSLLRQLEIAKTKLEETELAHKNDLESINKTKDSIIIDGEWEIIHDKAIDGNNIENVNIRNGMMLSSNGDKTTEYYLSMYERNGLFVKILYKSNALDSDPKIPLGKYRYFELAAVDHTENKGKLEINSLTGSSNIGNVRFKRIK